MKMQNLKFYTLLLFRIVESCIICLSLISAILLECASFNLWLSVVFNPTNLHSSHGYLNENLNNPFILCTP